MPTITKTARGNTTIGSFSEISLVRKTNVIERAVSKIFESFQRFFAAIAHFIDSIRFPVQKVSFLEKKGWNDPDLKY